METILNAPADSNDSVSQELVASEVIAQLMPEITALKPEDLIQVSVDVPEAVGRVFGSLPKILEFREQIIAGMPAFDISRLDKLEAYTIALNDAHGSYKTASEPVSDLDKIIEEAVRWRDFFRSDAEALCVRDLLDESQLNELSGTVGQKDLAFDLNLLTKVLIAAWPRIQGKSAVQMAELERASKLQQHLIRAIGLRDFATAKIAAAADLRTRIYTLFWRAYDSVKRAIGYLRWDHGDVDKIVPPLQPGRSRRRADPTTDPSQSGTVPAVGGATTGNGANAASGGATSASSGGVAAARPGSATAGAATDATPDAAAGTPGSQPFLSASRK